MSFQSRFKDQYNDELFEAILQLKDIEECYQFFEDICTIKELQSISQRLQVAKLLKKGKTYIEIEKETGASTATISRVNRCLHYGSDGYKLAMERLESIKKEDKEETAEENKQNA
ncbi:YerC/YecD family TrpR-related protein [Alkaliphilus hydrothermalis]|uniref:TrpR-related protein YerC/YecD n=1 Tax=Alkaliphilus hydrothermalis TaxID=1482730 RepID=A0ABS2NTW1_9FIRM|nr:YerC/YecD family TrpR-related protein [Alkaliphilus hydrothermalis]MBM7616014.1 TrpR-related protein YerC/YecD [Alkaliphilus hydrothermalis]